MMDEKEKLLQEYMQAVKELIDFFKEKNLLNDLNRVQLVREGGEYYLYVRPRSRRKSSVKYDNYIYSGSWSGGRNKDGGM